MRNVFLGFNEGQLSRPIVIPTTAEFRLLEILWVLEEGTIEDLLRASIRGRAFVYRPRVKRHEVSRVSLRSLLKRYFRGSRSELLVNLLEDERIGNTELQELEGLIRSYRKANVADRKTKR